MKFYPINLIIEGKLCVVVGGGKVARRKIKGLVDGGGIVRVISPEVHPDIVELGEAGKIDLLLRRYTEGDLKGAVICFAATSDKAVQLLVAAHAENEGVLVNIIDDPGGCDFHVPARVNRDKLLLTISTGGASPALSKQLRQELEAAYGEEYGSLLELLGRIRKNVVTEGSDPKKNKELFQSLLESDILSKIQKKDWKGLEEQLNLLLPDYLNAENVVETLLDEKRKAKSAKNCG